MCRSRLNITVTLLLVMTSVARAERIVFKPIEKGPAQNIAWSLGNSKIGNAPGSRALDGKYIIHKVGDEYLPVDLANPKHFADPRGAVWITNINGQSFFTGQLTARGSGLPMPIYKTTKSGTIGQGKYATHFPTDQVSAFLTIDLGAFYKLDAIVYWPQKHNGSSGMSKLGMLFGTFEASATGKNVSDAFKSNVVTLIRRDPTDDDPNNDTPFRHGVAAPEAPPHRFFAGDKPDGHTTFAKDQLVRFIRIRPFRTHQQEGLIEGQLNPEFYGLEDDGEAKGVNVPWGITELIFFGTKVGDAKSLPVLVAKSNPPKPKVPAPTPPKPKKSAPTKPKKTALKPTPTKPAPPKPTPKKTKTEPPKPAPTKPQPKKPVLVAEVDPKPPPAQSLRIAEVKRTGPVDFQTEILPILKQNCLACHNATEAESDLVLETPQTILRGGAGGPGLVPGNGAKSRLLVVSAHQAAPIMPPEDNDVAAKPLTPKQLGLIKLWIDQGARGKVSAAVGDITWSPIPSNIRTIFSVDMTDDAEVVAANFANRIGVFHVPTGQLISELIDPATAKLGLYPNGVAHLGIVQALALHPSGNLLASGGYRTVKLWSRQDDVELAKLSSGDVRCTVTSPDGKWLITGGASGEIKIYDTQARRASEGRRAGDSQSSLALRASVTGHTGAITDLKFFDDTATVYSASIDKTVRAWNLAELIGRAGGVSRLIEPEANASSSPKVAELWKLDLPEPIRAMTIGRDKPFQPINESDSDAVKQNKRTTNTISRVIVIAGTGNDLSVWRMPEPNVGRNAIPSRTDSQSVLPAKPLFVLKKHSKPVTSLITMILVGNAKQDIVVSGSEDGNVAMWDLRSKNIYYGNRIKPSGAPVTVLAPVPNPDSAFTHTFFLSGTADGALKLWDTNVQVRATFRGGTTHRRTLAGKRLAITAAEQIAANLKIDLVEADKAIKPATDAITANQNKLDKATKDLAGMKPAYDKILADQAATKTKLQAARATLSVARKQAAVATESAKKDTQNKALAEIAMKAQQAASAAQAAQNNAQNAYNKTKSQDVTKKIKDYLNLLDKSKDYVRQVVKAKADLKNAQALLARLKTEAPAAEVAHKKSQADLEAAGKSIESGGAAITSLAVTPDGRTLAFADQKGTTYVWRLGNPASAINEFTSTSPARSLAFVPTLARRASEGSTSRSTANNGPSLARRASVLVSFAADKSAKIRNLWPQWKLAQTLGAVDDPKMFPERIMALDFSPDGKTLVTASGVPTRSGDLKFFSVPDGKLVRTIAAAHPDQIFSVKYSHDGKFIASGGGDNYVRVFEATTGKQVKRFETQSHRLCLDWRGDDAFVFSSGVNTSIQYHRIGAGNDASRRYPRAPVTEYGAFRLVGRRRALATVSVSGSGQPWIWSMMREEQKPGPYKHFTYRAPGQPKNHAFNSLYSLAVSSDGRRFAVGGLEGVVYVWSDNSNQPMLMKLPTPGAVAKELTLGN